MPASAYQASNLYKQLRCALEDGAQQRSENGKETREVKDGLPPRRDRVRDTPSSSTSAGAGDSDVGKTNPNTSMTSR